LAITSAAGTSLDQQRPLHGLGIDVEVPATVWR